MQLDLETAQYNGDVAALPVAINVDARGGTQVSRVQGPFDTRPGSPSTSPLGWRVPLGAMPSASQARSKDPLSRPRSPPATAPGTTR